VALLAIDDAECQHVGARRLVFKTGDVTRLGGRTRNGLVLEERSDRLDIVAEYGSDRRIESSDAGRCRDRGWTGRRERLGLVATAAAYCKPTSRGEGCARKPE
jgi:hypothetical protein